MLLNRLKKAFTILELLVVIIIIGVVSIVAIPNVREFLTERETRSEVITISNIVGELKSELDGGLSRNPNKSSGDSAVYGTYVMGILTFEQYPDQFRVVKKLRSDEMFKNNKNCDPSSGQWDSGTPTYYQYDIYPGFKNIVITNLKDNLAYKYDDQKGYFMIVTKNELLDEFITNRIFDIEAIYDELSDANKIDDNTKKLIQKFFLLTNKYRKTFKFKTKFRNRLIKILNKKIKMFT